LSELEPDEGDERDDEREDEAEPQPGERGTPLQPDRPPWQ
jgi:hypothetical protein